ncbi:MAG: peptidyl-prolyl cis-trans isomerase [Planctomycetes bacterium]|nr:peptidyl-prolyl cis-trans isomerase [Planctomycetota bacterium]
MILSSLLLLAPISMVAPQPLLAAAAIALAQDEVKAAGDPVVMDQLAAIINDQVLTYRQVQIEATRRAEALGIPNDTPNLFRSIARNLLMDMLFREGYRQTGLDEGMIDQIVSDEVGRRTEAAGSPAAYAIYLEKQGTNLEQERKNIKQMLIATFFQQAELGIAPQLGTKSFQAFLNIAPSEVRKYYADHQAEYTSPRLVNARILMIRKDSVPNAEQTILDIQKQITGATSFAKKAAAHSFYKLGEGSLTGLTNVETSAFAAPLKDFMMMAAAGEFSEPLELPVAWALVHAIEVKEQRTLSIGEAHAQIEGDLLRDKRGRALQNAIDRLQKRCFIWLDPNLEGVFVDVYGLNSSDEEEL